MNEYTKRKQYNGTEGKPKAVIVDVDGTIADMAGHRKPFDWDLVKFDIPRDIVINMLHGIMDSGVQPVFLSGRDGVCKEDTYDWIAKNVMKDGTDFPLFMRGIEDYRKDYIIKEELFWKYVANNYDVVAAIDDRASVLRLWRELGIKNIIDVSGDRHYEF